MTDYGTLFYLPDESLCISTDSANITDMFLDYFHCHTKYNILYLKMKTMCFLNTMQYNLFGVMMEIVQEHVSDVLHITPMSRN